MGIEWGLWDEGIRYDVRVADNMLWYDQGQYHGRVSVQVRDRKTNTIYARIGDVKVIGNFSPIWVSILGHQYQLTEILRMDRPIKEIFTQDEKLRRRFKERGIDRPGPKDWLPPRGKR